eukprot:scaffold262855_cov28-Attheya_sp.AAC.1
MWVVGDVQCNAVSRVLVSSAAIIPWGGHGDDKNVISGTGGPEGDVMDMIWGNDWTLVSVASGMVGGTLVSVASGKVDGTLVSVAGGKVGGTLVSVASGKVDHILVSVAGGKMGIADAVTGGKMVEPG